MPQWLRIRLPRQETQVQSLVQEDPTYRGATKPCVPQLLSLCSRAREPQLLSPRATTTEARTPRARAPQQEKRGPHTTMKSSPRSPQLEKSPWAATKTQCSQK